MAVTASARALRASLARSGGPGGSRGRLLPRKTPGARLCAGHPLTAPASELTESVVVARPRLANADAVRYATASSSLWSLSAITLALNVGCAADRGRPQRPRAKRP
jgi:hypothetical protein